MEWTNDLVMEFIQLYEKHPVLWDPRDPNHKNRNKLNDAWVEISKEFSVSMSVHELRKKKESLLATYRPLAKKVRESETNGSGANDAYVPSWFAYDAIDRFIRSTSNRNPSLNSEERALSQIGLKMSKERENVSLPISNNQDENIPEPDIELSICSSSSPQTECSSQVTFTNKEKTKRQKLISEPSDFPSDLMLLEAIGTLKNLSSSLIADKNDDIIAFGQSVVAQLGKLPEEYQIECMSEIQSIITKTRLKYLKSGKHKAKTIPEETG